MASPIKYSTQTPSTDSWCFSALKWVAGDDIPFQRKVAKAGTETLGKMLASDEVAQGLNTLSEKTLFVHPVQGVNILLAVIQKGRKQLDLETFHALQVQFAAFIASDEYTGLDGDDRLTLSGLSKHLTALREEMAQKSDTEKAQCLAALQTELADIEQQVKSLVEKGSIAGKAATTFWKVLISEAKKVAPFLFRQPPLPNFIEPIEKTVVSSSHSNWEESARIETEKLAENGSACLTLQAFCEGIAGLKADMELYRILIDNGKDGLRQRVLNHLKSQGVSWIRYVFIWCFFSIGYWFIHRYTQRVAAAYLNEAFACIKNQKYEPLIDTTLQTVAQFYYEMNTKLRRTSNLFNEKFQQGLELPDAEELFKKIGNDLFKKAEINCIVAWLIKFFIGPPEKIVKVGMTSFIHSLHRGERGINHTLLNLLKRANCFHEAHAGKPSQKKHHSLRRTDLIEGLMRNLIDAARLTSCKTPDQVTSGVLYNSFPNDPIGNLLDQIPETIIDKDKRAQIRAHSQEELVRSAISGFADLVDELSQRQSLQQALCDGLMSANQIFSPETQEAQTPEQLDLAVRQHAVSLLNRILTEKLQLPDEAAPYFTSVTTPYVETFLTLISNSLHLALFQRLLAIYLTTS